MPELPEVETTRRGISPLLEGRRVSSVNVRNPNLRQQIQTELPQRLAGLKLLIVERRAKYLLFRFDSGTLIVHLGMSGSLRITEPRTCFKKHDHVEIIFDTQFCLRLHDPRRFGLVLWTEEPPQHHPLLRHLGPEPWDKRFNGDYLHTVARRRRAAVKNFIMNNRVVVGVGNIYASEALHRAKVHPNRAAGQISNLRYNAIVVAVREVLKEAVDLGGTTLRDFVRSDGKPGYFRVQLRVYGREGEPCTCANGIIRQVVIGQRSSFYCPRCQR
ncbi:MAG TPA: DNA-formamidopyrimidine glycosylase [Gammaproteobacteria bacterium]|nr:DNA-formamidopyrimidine glycosylase [Gammaproteobacteria bacterium]